MRCQDQHTSHKGRATRTEPSSHTGCRQQSPQRLWLDQAAQRHVVPCSPIEAGLHDDKDNRQRTIFLGLMRNRVDQSAAMKVQCNGEGCDKTADMQCPICQQQSGGNASQAESKGRFCSQLCFKKNWAVHKQLHVVEFEAFPGYQYSGPLRPFPYGSPARRSVPPSIRKPDYAETGVPRSEMDVRNKAATTIPVLTIDEQARIREACRLAREVLDLAGAAVKVGVTGDDIDRLVHEETLKRDCYPSPLNYRGFPRSCCVSVNEVICHGIPDTRPFKHGDLVNIDVTIYTRDGFHADLNETYVAGGVEAADAQGQALVACARECLRLAIAQVRPGLPYKSLGAVIEKHARSAAFSVVRNFCGHGIGYLFHGPPSVPHYTRNRAVGIIRAGHVFTIEPMINVGTWHDTLWPDGWTAVTADGKRSAQFEHTLLVTETGCEVLTASSSEQRFYA